MGSDNFYRDEPLFGLDIGHFSMKVMQIDWQKGKPPKVLGYGMGSFPPGAIINGVINNFEQLNEAMYDLFKNHLVGSIFTRRVACTIPTSHTFSRLMKIPLMEDDEIAEAIKLEAEQYIPMPVDNLYIDYDINSRSDAGIELQMVATPKAIVDSYVKFLEIVNLDPITMEPTMNANSRLIRALGKDNDPAILIDFGSVAIDVAVVDKTIFVNSTLAGGSEAMTNMIAQAFKVDQQEAFDLKSKYGIGNSEKQQQITNALAPLLENLIKEVKKILRYYDDRSAGSARKITHILTCGGGATMPGIGEYVSKELGLPISNLQPWPNLDFAHLKKPMEIQQSAFLTVAGEAFLSPEEIFI